MEIKTVELRTGEYHDVKTQSFWVTYEDGTELDVPMVPGNRHYIEVREWYKAQKEKPFKFKFAK